MTDIQGWEHKRLSDLAEYINGYAFKPEDWGEEGLPIIRIEQLKNPESISDFYSGKLDEKNIIQDGDLIFSWSASLFLRIWQHGNAALNQHLFKVVEKEWVDRIFLKQFIEYYLPEITKASHGSTMQHITRKELDRFGALFPTDKPEQSTIAEVLSKVDQAIEQTESLIAKQQHIKTGLMQDLLTRGIDENGNLRSEETHEFKDSPLGRIPVEWEVKPFNDCVSIVEGQKDPRKLPYREWILIAPDHIETKSGRLIEKKTAFEQGAISGKYEFQSGDIVYSKIRPYLRKAVLIDFRGLCSADMYPLRPKEPLISDFLFLVILGEPFSLYAESVSERSGFPKINRSELSEFLMVVPKIDEQLRVSKFINGHNEYVERLNKSLLKLRSLKTALMQDLLTGKKRVTPLMENMEATS